MQKPRPTLLGMQLCVPGVAWYMWLERWISSSLRPVLPSQRAQHWGGIRHCFLSTWIHQYTNEPFLSCIQVTVVLFLLRWTDVLLMCIKISCCPLTFTSLLISQHRLAVWQQLSGCFWLRARVGDVLVQRLDVYSTHFPCVEVDSSCYAIPSATTTAKWVRRTPPGFLFHFKVSNRIRSILAKMAWTWQMHPHDDVMFLKNLTCNLSDRALDLETIGLGFESVHGQ